jgi:hypothetical protein
MEYAQCVPHYKEVNGVNKMDSKPNEILKQYCEDENIELLEYMGKTIWYIFTDEPDYKKFRTRIKSVSTIARRPVYYWMARNESHQIIYIGHTGTNIVKVIAWYHIPYHTEIVKLGRPKSTYRKGMYIQNENGRISPKKNGHKIVPNCWEEQDDIGFYGE